LVEDFEVKYQSPIKYLAKSEDKNYLQLRPDITFVSGSRVKYVVDAKYKEVLYDGKELSVSQADIYQMLAYSVRYECDNIALIYPQLLTDEQYEILIQEFEIQNYDRVVSIKLIQVDLEIEPSQLARDLASTLGYCNEGYEAPIEIG
jgi:5-methylcytosine-specific restriction enzyme subunit McrC